MPVLAVLDTCVLVPEPLRNSLLWIAKEGIYEPRWSAHILTELGNTLRDDLRLSEAQIERLMLRMREAFADAVVEEYEHRIAFPRNDPGDRHVLAAAIQANAEIIVTANHRDFPESTLRPFAIVARSPDQFLTRLLQASPEEVEAALRKQARSYRAPAMSIAGVLTLLERNAPIFAGSMRARLLLNEL